MCGVVDCCGYDTLFCIFDICVGFFVFENVCLSGLVDD